MGKRKLKIFLWCCAALAAPTTWAQPEPRVVIVGAGLAGLVSAYELQKAGIPVRIFESENRIGGRIYSVANSFDTKLVTNAGAELIDSHHTHLTSLIKELGLKLEPRVPHQAPQPDHHELYFFEGKIWESDGFGRELYLRHGATLRDWEAIRARLAAGDRELFTRLDRESIADVLKEAQVPESSLLYSFVQAALQSELGRSIQQLSGVLLFQCFDWEQSSQKIRFLGQHDEHWRVAGGTARIIEELTARITSPIATGQRLTSIQESLPSLAHLGRFTLEFEGDGGLRKTFADYIVMTVPFTEWKKIQVGETVIPEKIQKQFLDSTYGENAKIVLYFSEKFWNKKGFFVGGLSEFQYQIWDSSNVPLPDQTTAAGSLSIFTGTSSVLDVRQPELAVKKILLQLGRAFSDIRKVFLGAKVFHWPASYSDAYAPGQLSQTPDALNMHRFESSWGPVYFAGEAFSTEHRGYMNGAVETALVAAHALRLKLLDDRSMAILRKTSHSPCSDLLR